MRRCLTPGTSRHRLPRRRRRYWVVQRLHLRWRRWQLVSTRGRILVLLVGLVMAIAVLTGDVASRVSVQPVYAAQRLDESSAGSSTAAGPSDAPLGQTPVPFACDGNGY